MTESKINCPNCGTQVDVQNILSHQIEDDVRKKYEGKKNQLIKDRVALNENIKKNDNLVQAKVVVLLKQEETNIRLDVKNELSKENEGQINLMQKELNKKSEQLRELNTTKATVAKLEREKLELQGVYEAKYENELNKKLKIEKEKILLSKENKSELKIKELSKQLEDQIVLTKKMKQKQEQGSMQLQGEVQELAIEHWLQNKFPLDTIEEIKKGVRGADCLQIVNTYNNQNCGTIYYESKRTQNFQASWIEKFKNDIRDKGANIGVLVTEVMPSDMNRMGLKDGVWICNYDEFKGLSMVLRQSIIELNNVINTQENKGDKMVMLYNYLTGNEFRLQVEGIVEGFTQMQADLISEKRSIQGHWKKREKQIEKVINNTNFMYSSIKGIAGNAIQDIQALEYEEDVD